LRTSVPAAGGVEQGVLLRPLLEVGPEEEEDAVPHDDDDDDEEAQPLRDSDSVEPAMARGLAGVLAMTPRRQCVYVWDAAALWPVLEPLCAEGCQLGPAGQACVLAELLLADLQLTHAPSVGRALCGAVQAVRACSPRWMGGGTTSRTRTRAGEDQAELGLVSEQLPCHPADTLADAVAVQQHTLQRVQAHARRFLQHRFLLPVPGQHQEGDDGDDGDAAAGALAAESDDPQRVMTGDEGCSWAWAVQLDQLVHVMLGGAPQHAPRALMTALSTAFYRETFAIGAGGVASVVGSVEWEEAGGGAVAREAPCDAAGALVVGGGASAAQLRAGAEAVMARAAEEERAQELARILILGSGSVAVPAAMAAEMAAAPQADHAAVRAEETEAFEDEVQAVFLEVSHFLAFLRVDWVAVPEALRARHCVNRCCWSAFARSTAAAPCWPPRSGR
jgi:hypothetical protein